MVPLIAACVATGIGNFIAWGLCAMLSDMARASLGLKGASLVNALRGRPIWSNAKRHYLRMW